jgi:hypothetical protein
MAAVSLMLVPPASSLWSGIRPGRLTPAILAAAGVASAGLMSAINFALGSDFRWRLLAPVVLWSLAVASVSRTRFK